MSERTGTQILESIEGMVEQALAPRQSPPSPYLKRESDVTIDLYKALALAQKSYGSLEKTGFIAGRNNYYAKLSDLIAASREALFLQNLVCHTFMRGGLLISKLVHFTTGQFIESELPLLNNSKEQERGSSITYAWRYTYAPLIGLVDNTFDDDGEITRKK